MKPFEMQEHTSDIKLRATGATREDVFVNAAKGMAAFLFGEMVLSQSPTKTENMIVESTDTQSLLVDWLSELLYLSNTFHRAYVAFRFKTFEEQRLEADVLSLEAEAIDDIKAATYHELTMDDTGDHWEATIVFDV